MKNKIRVKRINEILLKHFEPKLKKTKLKMGELNWLYKIEELDNYTLDCLAEITNYNMSFFKKRFPYNGYTVSNIIRYSIEAFRKDLVDVPCKSRLTIVDEFRVEVLVKADMWR